MKPQIPFYLNPIAAMLCQGFVLLTIVLFIFNQSVHSQGLMLEKEAGAQVAYFVLFQGISLLLMHGRENN